MAIIVAMLGIGLHRAFITNINWDEFYFLSLLHLYQNGTLTAPLQTIHVHLFGWLPFVSDNEIHQIFAARLFIWLVSLGSCWLIYNIAKKFCTREAALFPVLFYLGFSYVTDHGLSFRADPLCAFLFLASLHLLLANDGSRVRLAFSAVLAAGAFMVSIKSVFYLATIGPILLAFTLIRPVKPGAGIRILIYIATFLLVLLPLYQFHSASLPSTTTAEAGVAMMSAGNKTLMSGELFPRAHYIVRGIFENLLTWLFIFMGFAKVCYDTARGNNRQEALLLLSFALPLLSLTIYRNAYPYFFVFLMPAVVVLGGVFADLLITHFLKSGAKILMGVLGGTIVVVSAKFMVDYGKKLPDQTIAQSEIVSVVHRMFPEPVPYIDRNSMIASFPKVGFFMSSWGLENYRGRNTPVMEDLIRRKQPKFLIVNNCALNIWVPQKDRKENCGLPLLTEDIKTLRASFVPHWGPIYVAGKSFNLDHSSASDRFETLIAGRYTLEATETVLIDGTAYQPGEAIQLDRSFHTIASTGSPTRAILKLGTELYKPSNPPSSQQIYTYF